MSIPVSQNGAKKYTEDEIIKYIDKILMVAPVGEYFKPSDFFTMYEFPPFPEIKQKMFSFDYITHNTNVTYLLTQKGVLAKQAGGHYQYIKLEEKKSERLEKKEYFDYKNSKIDAKTKWIIFLISIVTAFFAILQYFFN